MSDFKFGDVLISDYGAKPDPVIAVYLCPVRTRDARALLVSVPKPNSTFTGTGEIVEITVIGSHTAWALVDSGPDVP